MPETAGVIRVQVCYATADRQLLHDLALPSGSTLQQAIQQSGVLATVPEIDLSSCKVGIYGKVRPLDTLLVDRDRIEIYRPLVADPKQARRNRIIKKDRQNPRA